MSRKQITYVDGVNRNMPAKIKPSGLEIGKFLNPGNSVWSEADGEVSDEVAEHLDGFLNNNINITSGFGRDMGIILPPFLKVSMRLPSGASMSFLDYVFESVEISPQFAYIAQESEELAVGEPTTTGDYSRGKTFSWRSGARVAYMTRKSYSHTFSEDYLATIKGRRMLALYLTTTVDAYRVDKWAQIMYILRGAASYTITHMLAKKNRQDITLEQLLEDLWHDLAGVNKHPERFLDNLNTDIKDRLLLLDHGPSVLSVTTQKTLTGRVAMSTAEYDKILNLGGKVNFRYGVLPDVLFDQNSEGFICSMKKTATGMDNFLTERAAIGDFFEQPDDPDHVETRRYFATDDGQKPIRLGDVLQNALDNLFGSGNKLPKLLDPENFKKSTDDDSSINAKERETILSITTNGDMTGSQMAKFNGCMYKYNPDTLEPDDSFETIGDIDHEFLRPARVRKMLQAFITSKSAIAAGPAGSSSGASTSHTPVGFGGGSSAPGSGSGTPLTDPVKQDWQVSFEEFVNDLPEIKEGELMQQILDTMLEVAKDTDTSRRALVKNRKPLKAALEALGFTAAIPTELSQFADLTQEKIANEVVLTNDQENEQPVKGQSFEEYLRDQLFSNTSQMRKGSRPSATGGFSTGGTSKAKPHGHAGWHGSSSAVVRGGKGAGFILSDHNNLKKKVEIDTLEDLVDYYYSIPLTKESLQAAKDDGLPLPWKAVCFAINHVTVGDAFISVNPGKNTGYFGYSDIKIVVKPEEAGQRLIDTKIASTGLITDEDGIVNRHMVLVHRTENPDDLQFIRAHNDKKIKLGHPFNAVPHQNKGFLFCHFTSWEHPMPEVTTFLGSVFTSPNFFPMHRITNNREFSYAGAPYAQLALDTKLNRYKTMNHYGLFNEEGYLGLPGLVVKGTVWHVGKNLEERKVVGTKFWPDDSRWHTGNASQGRSGKGIPTYNEVLGYKGGY